MHSPLEPYLQTVEQNLHSLPAEERQQELAEIRLHLESLLEANRELCNTEEEAVEQTLAQFGRAQTLGKDLTYVHQSEGKPQIRMLAGAVVFNYAGGMLLGHIVHPILNFAVPLTVHPTPLWITAWIASSLMTAFCVGWLTGVVAPRHAIKGTVINHLLGMCITFVITMRQPDIIVSNMVLSIGISLLISAIINISVAVLGTKWGVRWRTKRNQPLRLVR
jgi:hypothetical protein